MNKYEILLQEAADEHINVIEYNLDGTRLEGLYCDGNIALSKQLNTIAEKHCILSEEIGHHKTSVGNIIDLRDTRNVKQEYKARLWGYNRLIGLHGLINAFEHGCRTRTNMAEFLEVTEEYLADAISCYTDKYGVYTTFDNYIIYFIPNLAVGKMI